MVTVKRPNTFKEQIEAQCLNNAIVLEEKKTGDKITVCCLCVITVFISDKEGLLHTLSLYYSASAVFKRVYLAENY